MLMEDFSFGSNARRCCNTHNIYCLDYSGSMSGSSWQKILAYLTAVSGTSTYASVVGHGGMPFNIPNSQCGYSKTYMTHQLNAALPPGNLDAPYGNTCYDDALNEVMEILAMNFPDNTCIYFFSDGWETLFNSGLIPVFKAALNQFRKKTTCPVCIRCYETYSSPGYTTNF